jgi:hypothetical protein
MLAPPPSRPGRERFRLNLLTSRKQIFEIAKKRILGSLGPGQ